MEIIAGHANADFDCLGAMIAAHLLYPDALLVLPGGTEKRLHDYCARFESQLPTFTSPKEIDCTTVSRLILVDCQHPERIGALAACLSNKSISVHIFDHHPVTEASILADGGIVQPSGSTSTILAGKLRQFNLSISPVEATTVMLGIYEDTGKLLFPGTGTDDFNAAAWLLSQGANLQIVAEYVSRGLTAEQVGLLDRLLTNLSRKMLNGVPVAISFAVCEEYVNDISRLAEMMREMERLDVLFLLVDMGNSIAMVGRSRLSDVDAGAIMRHFGGGGHTTAASATVRGQSLKQLLEKLERLLTLSITPCRTARNIMSSPVKTLPSGIAMEEALLLLIRYNCTSMPVVCSEKMVGIISRKTVEKALFHGLGSQKVDEYMHTDFFRATPETSISSIQVEIVGGNQRFVPVFDGEQLVGAVTRTDLLRYLYSGIATEPESIYDVARLGFVTRHHLLEKNMKKHLLPEAIDLLRDLGATADALNIEIYAVGGFVRDLILGISNFDIDITVDGDGIFFAEQFVAAHRCRLRSHKQFGTAVIIFPDGSKVDVASTRLEYYKSPGVLPTVERSSLRHDLYRRDFTINTLAISLNKGKFGVVTDYFGGRLDLQKRVIKVLHNLSFVEDPSRVFRAIRFEQRLNFTIAPHTEHLMRNTVRMNGLEPLSGSRIFHELLLIMKEQKAASALKRLEDFELLPTISPTLKLPPDTVRIMRQADDVLAWYRLMYLPDQCKLWMVYFLAFTNDMKLPDFKEMLQRLSIPQKQVDSVFGQRGEVHRLCKNLRRIIKKGETLKNSELYQFLHGLAMESLLYLAAMLYEEELRRLVSLYLTKLRTMHTSIDGTQLKDLGLKPGSHYRTILQKLLYARLDGEITEYWEELQLAKELIKNIQSI